jgi:trimeric autotransporter adhesin
MVVALACVIVAVFLVPLPRVSLFRRLVTPATNTRIGQQLAELEGFDTAAQDGFGDSVAISGSTIVVGADGHASAAGRAYVFTDTGGGWRQTAELVGSDTRAQDGFGSSVAISGTNVIVDGGSATYVFSETGASWKQVAELKGLSGNSLALSGTTAVVGAPVQDFGPGSVYLVTKTPAGWEEEKELESTGAEFGYDVAISGNNIVVVQAWGIDLAPLGLAFVFTRTVAGWTNTAELRVSNSATGIEFADSAAISGTTVVVGAPFYGSRRQVQCCPKVSGRALVFARAASRWTLIGELKGADTVAGDWFGSLVAVSGATALVGAILADHQAGRVYVFRV